MPQIDYSALESAPLKTRGNRVYKRKSIAEVFWSHVHPASDNQCWDWEAATYPNGYGHIRYQGHDLLAHRVSWELNVGPIPEGLKVLHHCDRVICQNYKKCLFLGTSLDNSLDMVSKKRQANNRPDWINPNIGLKREVCEKGHPMTPDNITITRNGKFGEARRCTICFEKTKGITFKRARVIAGIYKIPVSVLMKDRALRDKLSAEIDVNVLL